MRLTVGKKLGGIVLVLMLLFVLLGIISYTRISRINDSLMDIIQVEAPTGAAAYEMEINLIGTGFGIMGYLKDHDPKHLERIEKDIGDFETFQKAYYQLCTTDKGRGLGVKIKKEFDKVKTLANRLVEIEQQQTKILAALLDDYEKMDDLLDDKIQASIRADESQAFRKMEASMEMEININGISKGLGSYLRTHQDKYEERIKKDEEDFRIFLASYQSLNLSSNERKWANEIKTLFETNVKRAREIVDLDKQEMKGVSEFVRLRRAIDAILDDEIQVLTDADLKAAEAISMKVVGATIFLVVVFTLAGIIVGGFTSYRITRAITAPIIKLSRWSNRIASGDLSQEEVVVSDDEIGDLNTSFKRMVENLSEFSRQNIATAQNLNSTAAEILAAVQQQASSTKEQAVSIQQTTTTMEEVNQTGMQISEKAREVAQAAEATSSSSVSGIKAVEESNETMDAIKEQVELMAENIVMLSEKTQVIGDIIATVNDIAEQSNLLALNAAIEAVGAGEQGQRFSVVANEIKSLADRAKESTVQVRTILGEIQKGINTSVMATEEAVKRVETGKSKAEIAAETIRQLTASTQESVKAFQQIVGGTNQQQIGLEQVTEAFKNIRTAVEQTSSGINQVEKAVAILNELSQQLTESVEKTKVKSKSQE